MPDGADAVELSVGWEEYILAAIEQAELDVADARDARGEPLRLIVASGTAHYGGWGDLLRRGGTLHHELR